MRHLFALLLLLLSEITEAAVVQPTSPIHDEDRIVGFNTEDPNLFYIVPERWRLHERKAFLEQNESGKGYALYFILSPDYSHARTRMAEILNANPNAILLPIPQNITEGFLDVPDVVGTVSQRLTPDNAQYFQSLLYYRLELSETQRDLLTQLSESGNHLLGRVIYSFPYQSGTYSSVNDVHLELRASDLMIRPRGPEYAYLWIEAMLTNYHAELYGVLDGRHPLGGGVTIGISSSKVVASVDTEQSLFLD